MENSNILPPHHSFTKTESKIQSRLISSARIISGGYEIEGDAQWDTGATNSCISHLVANRLHLIPTGRREVGTPSGSAIQNTYLVDIELPNHVTAKNVMVFESEIDSQGIILLIGMDIISRGDFAVSNFEGITKFSYRSPSVKHTDYVQETNVSNMLIAAGTQGKGSTRRRSR